MLPPFVGDSVEPSFLERSPNPPRCFSVLANSMYYLYLLLLRDQPSSSTVPFIEQPAALSPMQQCTLQHCWLTAVTMSTQLVQS
ncbi:MAG: hypothetical protein MUF49_02270 [Oculatellaceae cyanobacterium Prado106]|nr:hypothetical protein [Oculatellaceae cyanobacterium Prado106]